MTTPSMDPADAIPREDQEPDEPDLAVDELAGETRDVDDFADEAREVDIDLEEGREGEEPWPLRR